MRHGNGLLTYHMIVIREEYWIKKGRENKMEKLFHKQIFQKAYGNISVLEMALINLFWPFVSNLNICTS